MTGVEQHHSIGSRKPVLPLHPRKHRGHNEKRRGVLQELVTGRVLDSFRFRAYRAQFGEPMMHSIVVVQPLRQSFYPDREEIDLNGMPCAPGGAGLVKKTP